MVVKLVFKFRPKTKYS